MSREAFEKFMAMPDEEGAEVVANMTIVLEQTTLATPAGLLSNPIMFIFGKRVGCDVVCMFELDNRKKIVGLVYEGQENLNELIEAIFTRTAEVFSSVLELVIESGPQPKKLH